MTPSDVGFRVGLPGMCELAYLPLLTNALLFRLHACIVFPIYPCPFYRCGLLPLDGTWRAAHVHVRHMSVIKLPQ